MVFVCGGASMLSWNNVFDNHNIIVNVIIFIIALAVNAHFFTKLISKIEELNHLLGRD